MLAWYTMVTWIVSHYKSDSCDLRGVILGGGREVVVPLLPCRSMQLHAAIAMLVLPCRAMHCVVACHPGVHWGSNFEFVRPWPQARRP
jgi:hypothetical protein